MEDHSLLSAVWTYSIPNQLWKIEVNGVEALMNADNDNVYSTDGYMEIVSGTKLNDKSILYSKKHPRYQPNRGHLYSTSISFADLNVGEKDFGLSTLENGVYFRQKEGKLFAVKKSLGVEVIEEIAVPEGIDIKKASHIADFNLKESSIKSIEISRSNKDNLDIIGQNSQ